jgi:hypothetical protein
MLTLLCCWNAQNDICEGGKMADAIASQMMDMAVGHAFCIRLIEELAKSPVPGFALQDEFAEVAADPGELAAGWTPAQSKLAGAIGRVVNLAVNGVLSELSAALAAGGVEDA